MNLIDEQKHLSILHHLSNHLFDSFLKLTTVFGPGHHTRQIQGQNALLCNGFRYISLNNHLRQAFHDGGLSNSRLTDQTRVILRPSAQDLNQTLDLRLTSNDRIQLALSGKRR